MKILPNKIECTITHEGQSVPKLMIQCEFAMSSKNNYFVTFGPTNWHGYAELQLNEILRQANAQLEIALMDYQPFEGAFDQKVKITIMDVKDLTDALAAYEIFKSVYPFPTDYQKNLKEALSILLKRGEGFMPEVNCRIVPGTITIKN